MGGASTLNLVEFPRLTPPPRGSASLFVCDRSEGEVIYMRSRRSVVDMVLSDMP